MFYKANYLSEIGNIELISDGIKLFELNLNSYKNFIVKENLEIFIKTKKWLDDYFNQKIPTFEPELSPVGSEFRLYVWKILSKIPYGEISTYSEVKDELLKTLNKEKMCTRAVGSAIKNNPIPIIIPCHRVIGKDRKMHGFNLGIDIKIKLLEIEGHKIQNGLLTV